jgi:DNA polymerase-3 subunit chi
MTQIDFYTLEPGSPGDRLLLVCRLAQWLRQSARRILIHCPDGDQAQQLDRLLWTFREESFLPHGLVGQPGQPLDLPLTPILIARDAGPETEDQVLINLALQVPPFFSRFERVCEPLDQDPEVLAAGRERFRFYRDRGYPLEHLRVRLPRDGSADWQPTGPQ